jgi:hypothetical protein
MPGLSARTADHSIGSTFPLAGRVLTALAHERRELQEGRVCGHRTRQPRDGSNTKQDREFFQSGAP